MARDGGRTGPGGSTHAAMGLPVSTWILGTLQGHSPACGVLHGDASHPLDHSSRVPDLALFSAKFATRERGFWADDLINISYYSCCYLLLIGN